MAVGKYTLPICDGCNLPWLPVGWQQDSDPRALPVGAKPLRCGKCKSIGWDREHVKQMKTEPVDPYSETRKDIALALVTAEANIPEPASPSLRRRCRHRMTDCSICFPKEAA